MVTTFLISCNSVVIHLLCMGSNSIDSDYVKFVRYDFKGLRTFAMFVTVNL
jgi:hypothetical protein